MAQSPDIAQFQGDNRTRANPKPDNPGGGKGGGGGDDGGNGGGNVQVLPSGIARVLQNDLSGLTGTGVGVAIFDTGLDHSHTDLAQNIGDCYDAFGGVENTTACEDDNDHGTHVGGIVTAVDNNEGVVGVAPNALLHGVKVLDAQGGGTEGELIAGLEWVTDNANSIRVVNMSLSGVADCGPLLQQAVTNARNAGVVLFAAARNADALGNVKSSTLHFPANCVGVMSVGSATAQEGSMPKKGCSGGPIPADAASRWGNFDADISAPGQRQENWARGCAFVSTEGIESLKRGGGTFEAFGTSMATPHVAGLAALLLEHRPCAIPQQIEDAILNGIDPGPIQWLLSPDDALDEGVRRFVKCCCFACRCEQY